MYGDGCFDAWTGRNGFIYELDPHLNRLYRSIFSLRLKMHLKKEELRAIIIETVKRNALKDFYIKVLVTRGASPEPVIDPRKCGECSVIVFVRPVQTEVSEEQKQRGVRVKVLGEKRIDHDTVEPKIKSLNYLHIVMGKLEAWAAGYDEAVFMDVRGFICECPGFNILAVSGNKLYTPSHDILQGITRNSMIAMAKDKGMEVEQGFYTLYDFINADEVMITNTVAGVAPVGEIDGYVIGTGKQGPATAYFADTYEKWMQTGVRGTQCFPEAWEE
jgi:branched-chain amino acid aminotransferase